MLPPSCFSVSLLMPPEIVAKSAILPAGTESPVPSDVAVSGGVGDCGVVSLSPVFVVDAGLRPDEDCSAIDEVVLQAAMNTSVAISNTASGNFVVIFRYFILYHFHVVGNY